MRSRIGCARTCGPRSSALFRVALQAIDEAPGELADHRRRHEEELRARLDPSPRLSRRAVVDGERVELEADGVEAADRSLHVERARDDEELAPSALFHDLGAED